MERRGMNEKKEAGEEGRKEGKKKLAHNILIFS
jgi:hypothetical protein